MPVVSAPSCNPPWKGAVHPLKTGVTEKGQDSIYAIRLPNRAWFKLKKAALKA